MDTPRTSIKKALARIRRELDSFEHKGRREACEAWLRGELSAMLQQAGGEGVSGGAGRSECDLSAVPKQNPQLVAYNMSEQHQDTAMIYRTDNILWDGDEKKQAPVLKEEAQCPTQGQTDSSGLEISSLPNGVLIVAQEVPEGPRWPAEGEVTIIGAVPNPSLMAVSLSDGRRVSLLKRFKQEYGRGRKYRVRLSTRGTLGNPIYEEAT